MEELHLNVTEHGASAVELWNHSEQCDLACPVIFGPVVWPTQ